ncbi:MAG: four helix bundle protein [Patescibacteria group bacterium]|nr:four helix bundle protein [Patescibacteria group bacterium]
MSQEGPLAEKSYKFALDIIVVCSALNERRQFVIATQLLRCGTSIGANIREAMGGQSKADFISKLSIAFKECLEAEYWICLLRDSNILDTTTADRLLSQDFELKRLLSRSLLTAKQNLNNQKA